VENESSFLFDPGGFSIEWESVTFDKTGGTLHFLPGLVFWVKRYVDVMRKEE
jgi:hypothetical protein